MLASKLSCDALASRQRLQLVAMNPTVLPVLGFHAEPVRSGHHNHNFSAGIEGLQNRRSVEGSGFELATRGFNYAFCLAPEILDMLFQALYGGLSGGKGESFILFTLAFERLPG